MPSPSSPTVHERHGCTLARAATVLAGIRAGGAPFTAFPGACSRRPVALGVKGESEDSAADRCGGSAGSAGTMDGALLPASR